MRFRTLELIRYGGFADRVFDFSESQGGRPDLHLIVGPNEAGKSTALQAIGDLLFGIPGQTGQNWRYDYGQLRIRAVIEHPGGELDVTRRKGNRDTLLRRDGTPYSEDPLSPLLGGVDRVVFERMFGLDHEKLRSGGEGILENRDDAARITLEAGTGVSNIGRELARLQDLAASLFKPGGQVPAVNRLMRERSDAMAEVRQSSIGDSEWAQVRQRRAAAEERRVALINEAEDLERAQARLDRLSRARIPLARLAQARSDREALGEVPNLPLDASGRLTSARAERSTAEELEKRARTALERIAEQVAAIPPARPILAQRMAIEALEGRRQVIVQAAFDLERRRAELGRIDARISVARTEAHLPVDAPLPSAGWRRRVATHLDALRTMMIREETVSKQRAKLERDRGRIEQTLSAIAVEGDADILLAAISRLPSDAVDRRAKAALDADRKAARAADAVAALAPWQGNPVALAGLSAPSEAEAAEIGRRIEKARSEIEATRKEAASARAAAERESATLRRLAAGSALPTPDVVRAARETRDEFLEDVRRRLHAERQSGDEAVGHSLAGAIREADHLADRRDSEAARVVEHQLAASALLEAQRREAELKLTVDELDVRLVELEADWASRLASIGFAGAVLPTDWALWTARRATALNSLAERGEAARLLASEDDRIASARTEIAAALRKAGGRDANADDPALIDFAKAHASFLKEAGAKRTRLAAELGGLKEELAALKDDEAALASKRNELDGERGLLATEVGIRADADAAMLTDAVEALTQIAEDGAAREGLVRQIDGIERDRRAFEERLGAVLIAIGDARGSDSTDQVRSLAAEVKAAVQSEEALARHEADRRKAISELEDATARSTAAQAIVADLMEAAGIQVEHELDRILGDANRIAALRSVEDQSRAELAGLDNGLGLESLRAELAAITLEAEAAERAAIEQRRRELAAEREEVGRTLAAADAEADSAATGSAAADAQQRVADTTAALAQSAEEHAEAVAAAALLRWVLDRHRANNQAPLIARAAGLFAQITAGDFQGLAVGYASDDRPVMLAVRSNGSEVGVEGLSEGTRDQLYLALRLASIGGHVAGANLPIICDDLLITADDDRAGQLLRALRTAAMTNQVIVFTHHDHLLGVADGALGTGVARVHRIDKTLVAA